MYVRTFNLLVRKCSVRKAARKGKRFAGGTSYIASVLFKRGNVTCVTAQLTFHELNFFAKVRLPSGTVVRIKRYYWGNNVEMQAPRSDKSKTEGMCGNFDGDTTNEFEFGGPDGDQNTADQNSFGESWR